MLQQTISLNSGNVCDGSLSNNYLIIILDSHAPQRRKYVRGSHSSFMKKSLSKAIIKRTKLGIIFSKTGRKQVKPIILSKKDYVTLLRKSKIKYRNVEMYAIINNPGKKLNQYYRTNLCPTKRWHYPKSEHSAIWWGDPISDYIRDRSMNAIIKYRTHSSIIGIQKNCASDTPFKFSF